MEERTNSPQFKSGMLLCGLSIVLIPVGFLAIGGGPCAGPNNALGSAILLSIGLGCAAGALLGSARVVRGFRAATNPLRLAAVASVCCAGLGLFAGLLYLYIGAEALQAYLRY